MASKNDQVFPVSLSEIAFILIFVLMLLLGFMIMQERKDKDDALSELANARHAEDAVAITEVMNRAQEKLQNALIERGVNNPAEVVQALVNAGEESAKHKRIQQESLDLTKKLVALEELRSQIEEAGQDKADKVTRERVESALELQQQIEALVSESNHSENGKSQTSDTKQLALDRVKEAIDASRELRDQAKKKLNIEVKPGGVVNLVRDVVEGARIAAAMTTGKSSLATLNAENDKLKTQVAFYEKRDKLRGLDHPPCWMDKESKIEYIFNVQTTPGGFVVTPGWPSNRENDARATDGFAALMDGKGTPLSASQFQLGAKPYLDYGKRQTPECRHFVFLSSSITEADRRDNARRLVNSFFYVLERRAATSQQ
ncbi:hypothetical protein AEP_00686 [Curvibacter sp. AEP1-3]|uniref:hypothetical protein n=1 Tax=Curvibacter sp. AEP1-3 TaxID=1844971 RepID=UPI000B3C433A|nr:hypothetical protein [Curvibacter sp. AEP1-3]ARV17646.1 hypothetical protein AEP_00686 [Curvibacter sp. AEP1-3]